MLNKEFDDVLDRIDLEQKNHSFISEEEKKYRKEAFEYAQASVALEGFNLSEEYIQEVKRFIQGEIDFQSLTAHLHKMTKTDNR